MIRRAGRWWLRFLLRFWRVKHGAQRGAAEDVDVEVRDFLVGVVAHVGEYAVAGVFQFELAGDEGYCAKEAGDGFGWGSGCEVGERDVLGFGDDQDVYRSLGVYVVEGEGVLVFVVAAAGDLVAEDTGEDVLRVVGA